jgi:S-adenosylmethionine-diacylglycerol 3-amino-3-carboxypropyl transferase
MRYSLGNEDCRTEHEALKLRPGDRVVCVTASGDRALHLLLADVASLTCVDPNPAHNHLLALKKAAMKSLPYEQYLAFVGFSPSERRQEMWLQLKESLPEHSRIFWEEQFPLIEKGVLYQGNIEKWCIRLAKLFKLFRKDKVARLFSSHDLDKQQEYLEEWNSKWIKHLSSLVTKLLIPGGPKDDYFYRRLQEYLKRHLAKESMGLSLALKGEISKESLPPYLSRLGSALIRSRLDRISCEDADLLSFLKTQGSNSIDAFSLSDMATYVDENNFGETIAEMVRVAKHGARFCLRQLSNERKIPDILQFSIRRDRHLEKRLEEQDRSFVYRFTAGTIQK